MTPAATLETRPEKSVLQAGASNDVKFFEQVRLEPWYQMPLQILIFGASGDLARRKTYPALWELYRAGILPRNLVVTGFARTKMTTDQFRSQLAKHLDKTKFDDTDRRTRHNYSKSLTSFLSLCTYRSGENYSDWKSLVSILWLHGNLLVCLAIPPQVFSETTDALKTALHRLEQQKRRTGFVRIILEKPFGNDVGSCQSLIDTLKDQKWTEEKLYRIDHYLGKDMVQNILIARQANPWLNRLFHKDFVSAVHIVFKERIGTEGRGGYFDNNGIIRDVVQNHLMQILTLVAMDVPLDEKAETIRNAKVAVLKQIPCIAATDCLIGQYHGYKDDLSIPEQNRAKSKTPTYACIRAWVQTPTWDRVPFLLEAGKAMDESVCQVRMYLRGPARGKGHIPNVLVWNIQPEATIGLTTNLKSLGYSFQTTQTCLAVKLSSSTRDHPPGAYSRLFLDALRGDQSHFVRDDELLEAWRIVTPLLQVTSQIEPSLYSPGSNGPQERCLFLPAMELTLQESLPQRANL